jgi:hypothetical protein
MKVMAFLRSQHSLLQIRDTIVERCGTILGKSSPIDEISPSHIDDTDGEMELGYMHIISTY